MAVKITSSPSSTSPFDKDQAPISIPSQYGPPKWHNNIFISLENLIKVDNFANKYALPTSKTFSDCTAEVAILIELSINYNNSNNDTSVSLTEVFGQEKLQTIFRNIFRNQLLNDVGLNPIYLKHCLNLSKNIRVFKLKRPNNLFTVDEQIRLIEKL